MDGGGHWYLRLFVLFIFLEFQTLFFLQLLFGLLWNCGISILKKKTRKKTNKQTKEKEHCVSTFKTKFCLSILKKKTNKQTYLEKRHCVSSKQNSVSFHSEKKKKMIK